jgi:hypothetical protein
MELKKNARYQQSNIWLSVKTSKMMADLQDRTGKEKGLVKQVHTFRDEGKHECSSCRHWKDNKIEL